jgi:hypothetical protein
MSLKRTAAAAAFVWMLAGAAAAQAQTQTVTFASSLTEQSFTVPPGVRSLEVSLVGGRGAQAFNSPPGGLGGSGARIDAELPVTPGQVLWVEVGSNGELSQFNTTSRGGYNGGGDGVRGAGGGGGASDIRAVRPLKFVSPNSRLAVAAGGGGGGEYGFLNTSTFAGGAGGVAAADGANGTSNGASVVGGSGGRAATASAGGALGAGGAGPGGAGHDGTAGIAAIGGSGGGPGSSSVIGGGGGGGGGYYGGGGGGGGGCCQAGGGGGGGGSNFVVAGGSMTVRPDATGIPMVSITYAVPTVALSASSLAFGTTMAPKTVTVTNQGSAPLVVSALRFGGQHPDDFFVGSDTCRGEIAPASSCDVRIHFAPQGAGERAATLAIASNASPVAVSQGPAGSAGRPGAAGPQGPAGQVQLVTCTTRTRTVKRKPVKRTSCTGKLVSGPVMTATGAAAAATLQRGKVVYATGTAVRKGARTQLVLQPVRTLAAGRYTLRVGGKRSSVAVR